MNGQIVWVKAGNGRWHAIPTTTREYGTAICGALAVERRKEVDSPPDGATVCRLCLAIAHKAEAR